MAELAPEAARSLRRQAFARAAGGLVVIGGTLFGTAGTLRYWQAWVYLAALFLPMGWLVRYLLRHRPELLERRMRYREKERVQVWIVATGSACMIAGFVLPGLDHRYGWSHVPVALVALADLVVVLAYALFARVMLINPYASRVVEVEAGQQLVDTGPYRIVRHPMYLAVLFLFTATAPALGSWWALLPAAPLPLLLAARIRNEEAVLSARLPGYREYAARTTYRLIPGLW